MGLLFTDLVSREAEVGVGGESEVPSRFYGFLLCIRDEAEI